MNGLTLVVLVLAIASSGAFAAEPTSGAAEGVRRYRSSTPPQTADALGLVPIGGEGSYVEPEYIGPNDASRPDSTFQADAGMPPVVEPTFANPTFATDSYPGRPRLDLEEWHLLPNDVLFRSFIAGVHAPRMGGEIVSSNDNGALLDVTIGSRLSLLRYGTVGPNSEGWELQVYGAALARLAMEDASDVVGTDYKFGVPLVWRRGPTAFRIGYDHLSSHVGDEYMIKNPEFERINYVRDSIELAIVQDVTEDISVYGEINRTFHRSGGAQPLHFQFGAEYEPVVPRGFRGAPVAAINTMLREEFDFEGSLGIVAGWQWRGMTSDDLLRLGFTLYTGRSRQFSFFDKYEKLFGVGLWYDF